MARTSRYGNWDVVEAVTNCDEAIGPGPPVEDDENAWRRESEAGWLASREPGLRKLAA
jgi:hypothetical protein